MIAHVIILHIEEFIQYKIKKCITLLVQIYGNTINKRKAFLMHKRVFEIVFDNWDTSFASLPRYVSAIQYKILA